MISIENNLWRLPLNRFSICLNYNRTGLLWNKWAWSCSLSLRSWEGKNFREGFRFDDYLLLRGVCLLLIWYSDSFSWSPLTRCYSLVLTNLSANSFSGLGRNWKSILGNQSIPLKSKISFKIHGPFNLKLLNTLSAVICHEWGEILWRYLWEFHILDLDLSRGKLIGLRSWGRLLFLGLNWPCTWTTSFVSCKHFI